jgi:Bacterial sugar transferase
MPNGEPSTLGWLRDVAGASLGLVVLAPVLALVAIAIKLDSAGPVLSTERHLGLHASVFERYRFRCHRVGTVALTRVGRVLRSTHLSEMPQLLNVLTGEMSLFGPAPIPVKQIHYNDVPGTLEGRVSRRPGIFQLSLPTTPMIDGQKALRLLGESVRDVGILIGVFGGLDAYFASHQGHPPGPYFLTIVELVALILVVVGIILESRK